MNGASDERDGGTGADWDRAGRAADRDGAAAETVLEVDGLSKTFGSGDDAVRAVDDVRFAVERGSVVGLLGPNGAGKTTLIKMLLGIVLPDEGRARVDGVDVLDSPREAYRSVAAMLEGARNVYWRLTVRENCRFFARLGGREPDPERIDQVIEDVGLTEKADTTVNELSRGMKQKTSLACTLVRETPITFLDEPTLGLDVESSLDLRQELTDLADAESRTILLSSHDMDVIEDVCDRVIIMNEGEVVVDDSVADLVDVFRTQAYRITLDGRLGEHRRDRLAEGFGAENWTREGERWRFDATRVQGEDLYDLLDAVRESPHDPVRIDSLDPDLEEVFLHVTENGGADGSRVGATDGTTRRDDGPAGDAPDRTVERDARAGGGDR